MLHAKEERVKEHGFGGEPPFRISTHALQAESLHIWLLERRREGQRKQMDEQTDTEREQVYLTECQWSTSEYL